ncbi:MAG: alpha/beta hydrolase [Dehalococcoidia bacterium]|nr:alpha/beta hydrolase [Dehalococcoidia bacterium]
MKSEDISFPLGQTIVDCTIAAPDNPGRYPGVVLVAGSGPTDRNWESPLLPGTNGSGRLIAEQLASSGYVTIRYDKRASGPRAQQNVALLSGHISFESHFDELQGAVSRLLSRPDVDPSNVFALTSSEGAMHALYYQTHSGVLPFAGMVLTGSPGRALSDVANYQVVTELSKIPNSDDLVSRYYALVKKFEDGLPFAPDANLPDFANNLIAALSAPVNQPFSREFWSFRPSDYVRKTMVPVLVVIGKKDIQTEWKLDGGALEEASQGKSNVSFFYPQHANHVLKHEPRPREDLTGATAIEGYNGAESVLDDDTLKTILAWLRKQSA